MYLQNCTHVTSFFLLLCDQPLSWSWPVPARLPSRLSVKLLSLPLISVFGSSPHFVQWTTFRLRFSLQLRLVFIKSTGQTLDRVVTVSSIHYCTSTSALSTSSSSRGLTTFVGISHLKGGFTLRCLQRLSLPDLATLPCLWQDNRYTSGRSSPVLSY